MSKVLFLDESGDHSLTSINQQHPFFVLGGVIMDESYAFGEMTSKLNAFKQKLFGTTEIILHTADFTRQRNGFERMVERSFHDQFYAELNMLLDSIEFQIAACSIDKNRHAEAYGESAIDPYHLSLDVVAERLLFDVMPHSQGRIIAEARYPKVDIPLLASWERTQRDGTRYVSGSNVCKYIESVSLCSKHDRIAGLEIADAIVTPIARHIQQRKNKIDIDMIRSKMRKNAEGLIEGFGLVRLPK